MSALGGAVVTGAGQGLGREIALRLARRGYAVHVTDRDLRLAKETVDLAGERAWASALDVRDYEGCRTAAEQAVERAGRLDLWVNNAGILITGPMWDRPMDVWEQVLEVNAIGTLHGVGAALEQMRPTKRGHIVNIASLAGLSAVPGEAVYAASKHAVVGLSGSTLADLRRAGLKDIHISVICPDGMWTPMLYDRLEEDEAAMSFSGTLLQPSQVADLVERVVDKPRPITSAPSWRGGLARVGSASPAFALAALPAVHKMGRVQQRRLAKKLNRTG
ncbi:SDR family oxidoreductase [Luteipulveratus mongoliensis]|uniref:Short-chain dehydrogenase n=1 Tax=Luteipulveratus mongoliensis TaxID=571913 RepID=A0A0K1JGK9_9MICO|nr:SDR family oxidoreductase [Luteipulveratus mongoliensis]AKU15849.1 short-chain dehydrogenase [Luteipulveratus mongoliensis]